MGVAEPLRRPTASRGRKRPRAAARLVGTIRAACRRSRLRVNPFLFWLLFSGVWETLIFGTGDWFAFGEPFFCGLFTPTYPLPGHRLVPESHFNYYFPRLVLKGIYHYWTSFYIQGGLSKWKECAYPNCLPDTRIVCQPRFEGLTSL